MNYATEDGVLTLYMSGRVDSSNADAFGAEINEALAAAPHSAVVADMEALEYISSAGLRVILRLRKDEPTLKLINVSADVYDIFEMTGFTEMLTIEKAYRRLSVEGCEVIGQGANGKVYRLDPDTIIKVYLNPDSLPDIHRERELARRAFVLGIPTAIPYDVVKVGDGYGSVFELLNAKSFAKLIAEEPENLDHYVELYVDLLKRIHSTVVKKGDMPAMKEVALGWAKFLQDYLPDDQYQKLYSLVEAVPENDHMMHGDYHLKNVMMQNGEVLLIDMDTLCVGDPVFEFASIYQAYVGFAELDPEVTMRFYGLPHETALQVWEKTLRLYFGTEDEAVLKEKAEKAMVIAYTRMMRRTIRRNGFDTEEGRAFIDNCKNHLTDLLGRVDSLLF